MSFQIHQKIDPSSQLTIVEVFNDVSYAKIVLDQGASLQELQLNSTDIIKNLEPLSYQETYASSILFPFTNRIKDGIYTFNDEQFQLNCNVKEENNALHGLVYNQKFKVVNQEATKEKAILKLQYIETTKKQGFPYTYTLELVYVFTNHQVSLELNVINNSSTSFPFTIGWHPYFYSESLDKSTLNFFSNKRVLFDDRMIASEVISEKNEGIIEIKDQLFDDCFYLDTNKVVFTTPNYQLELSSEAVTNFLQIYTPSKKQTIAIEPLTGISNSFNNKIGLQVLKPNENYTNTWQLKVNTNP